MSTTNRVKRSGIAGVAVLGFLAMSICLAVESPAASRVYHSGERVLALERSETELALELYGGDTAVAADARFRMLGAGTVMPLSWGPEDGRFALLRVADADAATRRLAETKGLVRSVRRVYRFEGQEHAHLGTGRLVVRMADPTSAMEAESLVAAYGARVVRAVEGLERTYLVEPIAAAGDEVELADRMHRDARTDYAHPDLIAPVFLAQVQDEEDEFAIILGVENIDPLASLQWHLRNTGQEGGVIGADINIEDAFMMFQFGAGVVVGMLDDACDVAHEDLLPNYINVSHDATTGSTSPTEANPQAAKERHGTAMMGLICAPINEKGIIGVAPSARFTASRGADEGLSSSEVAGALSFAQDRDVDVHCNSWAYEPGSPISGTVRNAVDDAFVSGRDGLGMVVVFPTGNDGERLDADDGLAGLVNDTSQKMVIGAGACNANERVASYSNYGVGIVDVLAPSGEASLPQIVTTDNRDDAGFDPGYNDGGFDDFGQENLVDSDYTQGDSFSSSSDPVSAADFFGTSAACAQVSGVAALVLGAASGPGLNATQVRSILVHTADRIPLASPEEGEYNVITGRSLQYGYGRVNAGEAVLAARLVTGNSSFTWPEPVINPLITDGDGTKVLSWEANDDLRQMDGVEEPIGDETIEVLVVQRVGLDFEWVPEDAQVYMAGQLVDYAQNVTVAQIGDNTSYEFSDALGVVYFGVFARNEAGRYSFGVSIDSEGNVVEVGRSQNTGVVDDNTNDNTGPPPSNPPTVVIEVSPLSGTSPLKVAFSGNAPVSDAPIESFSWDFGDGSAPVNQAVTEHTYTNEGDTTQTYTATLTATDTDGRVGRQAIGISVSPEEGVVEDPSTGTIRVVIKLAGEDADIGNYGEVGERVELSVDTDRLVGTPQRILWDLGDGTLATSFMVSHVYQIAGTLPISATVTASTSSGIEHAVIGSRLFTVLDTGNGNENENANENESPQVGGVGSGVSCGVGMLMPMLATVGLVALRRLRFCPR
ncbi:MAG: S8 family serine peptidase [bacterium]|nr:S8 family serine peptidase [bacterium]